jgi:hypothetical protein
MKKPQPKAAAARAPAKSAAKKAPAKAAAKSAPAKKTASAKPARTSGVDTALVEQLAVIVAQHDLSEIEVDFEGLHVRVARQAQLAAPMIQHAAPAQPMAYAPAPAPAPVVNVDPTANMTPEELKAHRERRRKVDAAARERRLAERKARAAVTPPPVEVAAPAEKPAPRARKPKAP